MLLISALLLIVRTMPSRPGIDCWLVGSLTQAFIYVIAYAAYPAPMDAAASIVFFSLQIVVCRAMCIGTLRFINKNVDLKKRITFTVLATLAVTALALGGFLLLASVLFVCYITASFFEVAYHLFKLEKKSLAINFSITLFVLNGLHWLDYPILGQIEWFAPIGFMVGMVLVVAIFLSLSALALLQFKLQTEESEQRAIQAAIHDPLTGLYNRSHLDQLFSDYAEEAEQIQRPFILLYFDLDGFKYVNDTYGHPAGDLILTTVAKRMSKWLGAKGDAVRVGGDELIVLTRLRANFSRNNALPAAEQILHLIEQPIVDGKNCYKVSASVGGCCYGLPNSDLETMITEADKLMYKAKKAGGHRICFSELEVDELIAQSKQGAQNNDGSSVAVGKSKD